MDCLAGHIADVVGDRDRRALLVETVVQHSIKQLLGAGEYRAATKSVLEHSEWAQAHADLTDPESRLNELERTGAQAADEQTLAGVLND